MAKQAHDQGVKKSRKDKLKQPSVTNYDAVAESLVDRGLCSRYILFGHRK
ncbi:hypothetical protein [Arthrobacter sp. U41]|nr:hypothetical protein [Arthrobacter sp. U41]